MKKQQRPLSGPTIVRLALLTIGMVCISGLLAACGPAQAESGDVPIRLPDQPPTAVIEPAGEPPVTASTPLFSATFDDEAALATLELVDFELPQAMQRENRGRWGIDEGTLVQRATVAYRPSTHPVAALAGDQAYGDISLSVDFYDQSGAAAGLIARRNGDSYYRYLIIADRLAGRPKQVLEKVVDGVATRLVEIVTPGYSSETWHTLTMTIRGGAISVTLDGRLVVEDLDPAPLPAGQAGLLTRATGGIRFDNLVVSATP